MTRRRRALTVLITPMVLLTLFLAGLYAMSWYYRWRATQLASAIRQLRPGITTTEQYFKVMGPALRHTNTVSRGDKDIFGREVPEAGAGAFQSTPEWFERFVSIASFSEFTQNWNFLTPASFFIIPTFKDGKLDQFAVYNWQGNGHPVGASVNVYAGSYRKLSYSPRAPDPGGYWIHQWLLTSTTIRSSHIELDDRATPEERRRALDFRFGCFTALRTCMDGKRMLDPALKRDAQGDQ